jgi:hypothetical protein
MEACVQNEDIKYEDTWYSWNYFLGKILSKYYCCLSRSIHKSLCSQLNI